MRATYLAFRLWAAGCAFGIVASGCAEGGMPVGDGSDDNPTDQNTGDNGDGGKTPARDAGKDSRVSNTDDSDSTDTDTGGNTKDAGGGTMVKDAGGGTTVKDASTDSGGGTSAAIKCPSPLICSNSIGAALALFGAKVGASDNLCASSGTLGLPMGVSCTSADSCKSSRLTTATCQAGYCIQPCTP